MYLSQSQQQSKQVCFLKGKSMLQYSVLQKRKRKLSIHWLHYSIIKISLPATIQICHNILCSRTIIKSWHQIIKHASFKGWCTCSVVLQLHYCTIQLEMAQKWKYCQTCVKPRWEDNTNLIWICATSSFMVFSAYNGKNIMNWTELLAKMMIIGY